MIAEKIQNRPAAPKTLAAPKEMVGDILDILRASLEKSAEAKKQPGRGSRTAPPAARARPAATVKQKRPRA
jgi:non-homologous end joining protein Ku